MVDQKEKPFDIYNRLLNEYRQKVEALNKSINTVSIIRTLVFFAGAGLAVYFYKSGSRTLILPSLLICLTIFIALIAVHSSLKKKKKYNSILCDINSEALKRLSGDWKNFSDDGLEFIDEDHPYSIDLDIFGRASLFQWINTTKTYTGRYRLKNYLLNPAKDVKSIILRQDSVKELSDDLIFRQRLIAEGMMNGDKMNSPEDLCSWAEKINSFYLGGGFILMSRLLPLITISLIILTFTNIGVTYHYPVVMAIIQVILLRIFSKDTEMAFNLADKYRDNIQTYERLIWLIESHNFNSQYLKDIQESLKNKRKASASKQIESLKKIVERFSMRYSELYFIFNMITLWDFQCLISLERWKAASGYNLKAWLNAIGEIEALASLSIIGFDNPKWVIPSVVNNFTGIEALNLGHPLLSNTRVSNDIDIKGPGEVLLITGSNMSGKSTFLRTTGINLALAYAGTFVCASSFKCSVMDIYTSMRTSDNLEKNVSSFYAELLRIKTILEACQGEKRIFFLLDEIFKGTNSRDRHTGARILIKKLSLKGALGLVSTHDLELADMESESDTGDNVVKVTNYHFKEHYSEDKIYFDYKLLPGVSNTRNAIYLMKLAGIDISDENIK